MDCIVLAGGGKEELAEQEGAACKALIKLRGREMVRYVLAALCALEQLARIVVVGPREELLFLQDDYPVEVVAEQGSITQNILAACRCLGSEGHILISTADIPLITARALEDLLEKCSPFDRDFYYPITGREKSEGLFPGVRRTYVSLQEGTFTGGNVFIANAAVFDSMAGKLEEFLDCRKSPLKMVSLLGAGFFMSYLRKKLSIAGLEARFSALFGLKAMAVISDYPEISFDVDKPQHLLLARQMLEEKESEIGQQG